jgi:two-component system, OmpR family, KDP operon response regulator KdpE
LSDSDKRDSSQPVVLAVDDDTGILQFIKLELSTQGFIVILARSGEEAIQLVESQRPDIVLLDVIMPEMNGLEVLRRLREISRVPVVLLTAKNRDQDKIRGLDMGADDYLPKPFNPEELSARVRAVLRRVKNPTAKRSVVKSGAIEIDLERRVVRKLGEPVTLTRTEWMLLQHLAANPGRTLLNAELLTRVWGPEYGSDLQYLRVWVSRLRSKLGEEGKPNRSLITTVSGVGYILNACEEQEDQAEAIV